MPEPVAPSVASHLVRLAWPAAFVAVAGLGVFALRERPAPPPNEVTVTAAGPTVVHELRTLARLETTSLHVEKIVEVADRQQHLHGLVGATDALLYVAVGEVTLGIDLAKLGDDDASFDRATGVARVVLPEPTVLARRFDEQRSHVVHHTTDLLARRNEGLEAAARREALQAFDAVGADPVAIDGAKAQAERQLRVLAKAWGARDLVVAWAPPRGEVSVVP